MVKATSNRPMWNRRAVVFGGVLGGMTAFAASALRAAEAPTFRFEALEGGVLDSTQWRGKPVMIVNTASMCGFARQFDTLQNL